MKRSFDPTLYLILDLALIGSQPPQRLIASAIAGGVSLVQLRGKDISARALCALGAETRATLAPHDIPLIINDDVAVAAAIGANGVHLGQDDLPAVHARRILGEDALIGLSVGTPEEAVGVDATLLDYVSIGPIAGTRTKGDAGPAIGTAGFQAVRRLFPALPAVAIGGITEANAADIVRAGAAGLAVASNLCCAVDPTAAARRLRGIIARAEQQAAS
ncbi:thiamine phosphate synthase [Dongia deserti]|uniref:thiamine phosphate synthase n=1 Tax=Dongia deserti TaxID=2268030 RepID=UPI000E650D58|nr:thiamine phosphate synthase [Dongia deserti]